MELGLTGGDTESQLDWAKEKLGEEISIKDLAIKLKDVINYQGDIIFDTSKPNGNPRKLLDNTVMQNLGWNPKFKLDEGLAKTYKWYLSNL